MLKRVIVKGCMIGVVVFGVVNYANYLRTGQVPQLPQWPSERIEVLSQAISQKAQSLTAGVASLADSTFIEDSEAEQASDLDSGADSSGDSALGSNGIYRWRDADGAVHFGDNPPGNAQQLKSMSHIDPDANVVVLAKPVAIESPMTTRPEQQPTPKLSQIEGAEQILDKAREARDAMNERVKQQQDILDQL